MSSLTEEQITEIVKGLRAIPDRPRWITEFAQAIETEGFLFDGEKWRLPNITSSTEQTQ